MKNLQLSYCGKKNFHEAKHGKLVLDSNGSKSVIYFYTNDGIASYDITKYSVEFLYGLIDIIGCEHLAINNQLCAASKFGEVILLNPLTKETEEVTFCEGGISRMSWSPDQEIVVFITGNNTIVVMTCTFDVIIESSLDDTEFGDQQFITVGWGKKETQFHGTEGKQAAKRKETFQAPKNIGELDKTINITWRGDSEFFAVSFVGANGRIFKVYNKEGRLQYTSEKINDLGTSIAWKPSGSWIAVPHLLPNKYTVALFEKNGLRHREIILPFKHEDEPVVNINWNTDSDILAIETVKDNKSTIYIYTICNYHWYLKQHLQFSTKIGNYLWDLGINEGKMLHILLEDGSYFRYKWNFTINHSRGEINNNQAVVAVIDGNSLLVTDFRNNIIPPPMSSFVLPVPNCVNSCGFLINAKEDENCNKLFAVTAENIYFYDLEFERLGLQLQKLKNINLVKTVKLQNENNSYPFFKNQWLWLEENCVLFCENKNTGSVLHLSHIKEDTLENIHNTEVNGIVCNISAVNIKNILYQLDNGISYSINLTPDTILEKSNVYLKTIEPSEKIEAVIVKDVLKLISLQPNRNLFIDDIKIASDVISFYLTKKYLVYTLLDSLKFIRLEDNFFVGERKIERGGKIIVIVPCDSRTILQMPRGNLEAIHPRTLSLDIVAELLDKLSYKKAMDILRKQRINLNIIIDHNPKLFLENLNVFLEEISNPQWINLFLTDLQNEDCTKTMYAGNYSGVSITYPDEYTVENKINYFCNVMCSYMAKTDFQYFLLPIITTYVKIGNLEKALDVIWNEKKKELNSYTNENDIETKSFAEGALKYLLYLVDVNDLYNVALGMYDFGLVLYVANKSQKDPKEYIPFLNQLQNYDENYRKFKIDEHLKKYENALGHIAKCGNEQIEEIIQFIEKHKLYARALGIFENNKVSYLKIALSFGDYLRAQGKHENASIMYERGGDLNQAILSAKHVLDWSRCLMLTKMLGYNNGDIKNISL